MLGIFMAWCNAIQINVRLCCSFNSYHFCTDYTTLCLFLILVQTWSLRFKSVTNLSLYRLWNDSVCFQSPFMHIAMLQYLLGDVLHHLELSSRGVDLVDGAGLDLVDELAENGAVLEDILEDLTGGELSSEDLLDPWLSFLLLFRAALGSELKVQKNNIKTLSFFLVEEK